MCFPILLFFISTRLWYSHAANSQFLGSLTEGDLQLQALLSIKDQISQDPFGILASWNNSLHFCNWTGVSCNHEHHQSVLGLNLSGLEFRGTLSSSIGNLTFLTDLNLENNFFIGSIPQEISQLYYLQRLVLSNNSFAGKIPRNLSYLLDLSVIDLDRNSIIGTIPAEIGSLSNLHELHISLNNLSGTIPFTLGNLSVLTVLSLSFNNLEGIIPQELGKLSNLQILQLSSNNLSGPLPLLLYNITSIQHLVLTSNKLSVFLPWEFGFHLPNLQTFSFGQNHFHGSVPASMSNISALEILDISGNFLSGLIPMDLGNLKQLQRLDFGGNSLTSNGLNFLNSLTNCTNLKVLHLNDNNHSGILPGSIANLSVTLVSLRLDGNYISGEIPAVWKGLKNLERLALSENSLTGTIHESIGELTKLQGLYLSNNRFVGEIPSSIGNITLLSILEMQQNMLGGGIPASLSNCTRLLALDLSYNRLTGTVNKQIFSLFSLTYYLNLSNNLLTGPLPFEIGRLTNLISFDISHNKFFGGIPSTISSCVTLQLFSIQGNLFNSSIPPSFGLLKNIQLLDLSGNNLSGQIPANLTSFPFIQFLNLSFNVLEGQVPKEGLFINATLFSIKGNENLCGGIRSLHLSECQGKVKFSIVLVLPSVGVIILMLVAYFFVFQCWPKTIKGTLYSPRPIPIKPPEYPPGYLKLSYAELRKSTDCFSPNNLIGTGRFSSVYKGILSSNQVVAVKVINLQERGAKKSFLTECEVLKSIRHANLVKIITSCSSTDSNGNEFKALVYEFMSNGDLDRWLHPTSNDSEQPKRLNLIQRFNIAIDVASALVYLHHNCEMPVIHHDIKPSNILLSDDRALVGDFGSARSLLLPVDETSARTRSMTVRIIGTVGYAALECGMGGRVSTLVDVYSFGILLLEMFTGKRPTDSMFKHNFSLRNYVKMAVPDHVMKIADPQLLANPENGRQNSHRLVDCLTSVFRIGVSCSAQLAKERMQMTDALMQLRAVRDGFVRVDERENPNTPLESGSSETDSSSGG